MNTLKHSLLPLVLLGLTTVTGCSSNVPLAISQDVAQAPSFTEVQQHPETYNGQSLRWGGTILSTENKQDASWITIVAFPLSDSGRPLESDHSPGRFIAVVDQFLEPLVYSKDREITVRGQLAGTQTLKVGNYPYPYPLLKVDSFHLWEPRDERIEMDAPYYWPYHPYYPTPFYNPRLYY